MGADSSKGKRGSRKFGRDKTKCERYRREGRREKNKARHIAKEAKRQEKLKKRKETIDETDRSDEEAEGY